MTTSGQSKETLKEISFGKWLSFSEASQIVQINFIASAFCISGFEPLQSFRPRISKFLKKSKLQYQESCIMLSLPESKVYERGTLNTSLMCVLWSVNSILAAVKPDLSLSKLSKDVWYGQFSLQQNFFSNERVRWILEGVNYHTDETVYLTISGFIYRRNR